MGLYCIIFLGLVFLLGIMPDSVCDRHEIKNERSRGKTEWWVLHYTTNVTICKLCTLSLLFISSVVN